VTGFAKVPSALALDLDLSLQARAVYPVLLDLAWTECRARAGEEAELPPLEQIAAAAGCSVTALKGYVSELRNAGWLETRRKARGRPQTYVIHASPREAESGSRNGSHKAENAPRVRRNTTHSRGHVPSPADLDPDGETSSLPGGPPSIVKVDGRNLPLDALADVCGISPRSPRFVQCVTALNGRIHKTTGEVLAVGITHLYWDEISAWAVEHDQTERLAALDAEHYSESLARSVRQKAERFRARMPGAEMSPSALRDWWLDLERTPAGAGQRRGGMTPDEIRNLGREDT
jgi:hypothetical protein